MGRKWFHCPAVHGIIVVDLYVIYKAETRTAQGAFTQSDEIDLRLLRVIQVAVT
jgi:hypothetical protein